jgi:hypothetical protein
MKRNLVDLYDVLFDQLESLKTVSYTGLEATIKRSESIRRTAQTIIDAGKLEVAIHKARGKNGAVDGLLTEKQLAETSDQGSGNRDQGSAIRDQSSASAKAKATAGPSAPSGRSG